MSALRDCVTPTPTRPALRYHGGKWKLAPWVIEHLPPHRVYVEPFAGAASVLLRKPRSVDEVINDRDGEIVNVFRVLRDPEQSSELERLLRLTPFAREELKEAYLPVDNPVELARRTLIRSFMGIGAEGVFGRSTGFRTRRNSNRPLPAQDWVNYPDCVAAITERLRGVVVENRDALEVIQQFDGADSLHYVDPPYPTNTRTEGHNYRYELTDDDHRRLAAVLREARGMVVLSGYPCELYDQELYPDWLRVTRRAWADGATERTECLWINPAAAERIQKQLPLDAEAPEPEPEPVSLPLPSDAEFWTVWARLSGVGWRERLTPPELELRQRMAVLVDEKLGVGRRR